MEGFVETGVGSMECHDNIVDVEKTAEDLSGGQKICHEITQLCKQPVLHGNKIYFCWVPRHRHIQGNEHADWLAKTGLKRKAKDPFTSLC
jgi:ribonuclease HI